MYRNIGLTEEGYILGNVQYVPVENNIIVANMIAQHGVKTMSNEPPIRYNELRVALQKVFKEAKRQKATVHMPRIGAGLAGGDWSVIENIIEQEALVNVWVYDLP